MYESKCFLEMGAYEARPVHLYRERRNPKDNFVGQPGQDSHFPWNAKAGLLQALPTPNLQQRCGQDQRSLGEL
jgi:hypothetical protein